MIMRAVPALAVLTILHSLCAASDPTAQINSLLTKAWHEENIEPAERCSDATFVRRIYLDLAGRIPQPVEIQAFTKDSDTNRRTKLIDRLLQSEEHAIHFAELFDTVLMGRASPKVYQQRESHGWKNYLTAVFRDNRRWDEVAREMLLARPRQADRKGAVWFLYERKDNHQAIAEAIAPSFFGIRIECAQCHDHMLVDEITQADYWGLVAFFNRGKNKQTPTGLAVSESAIGGFSEFANLEGSSTPNLLKFVSSATVHEARPNPDVKQEDKDEYYLPAEVQGNPQEPVFSRRKKFVTQVLDGHPLVARAMVNRIWNILMGRGLVHPHDQMDSMHPASHPELLDWLSEDYAASGFDTRRLIRGIVCSNAYQLDSSQPMKTTPPDSFAWYAPRPLTAEQLARSVQFALSGEQNGDLKLLSGLRQQFADVVPETVNVSVANALFMSNNASLYDTIQASHSSGKLLDELLECASHDERATVLFQRIMGRPATQDEIAALTAFLEQREDRLQDALTQTVWALLASSEFYLNH